MSEYTYDFKLQYIYYTFDVHRLTPIVIVQKNVIVLPTIVSSYILYALYPISHNYFAYICVAIPMAHVAEGNFIN